MKTEMKMFAWLPLYIVTTLFAFGCVSALPIMPQEDPGILENIEQTLGEPCPDDWTRFDDYCYLVSSSVKTRSEAQAYCQSLGGNLVKISSAEENTFVLDLVRKDAPSVKSVWIGLHWYSGDFYWYDYSVLAYENWAPGEPNGQGSEPCGQMYAASKQNVPISASGYWNDLKCDWVHNIGFVCERLP